MFSDRLIIAFDGLLKTFGGEPQSRRPDPAAGVADTPLDAASAAASGRLLRVDHAGEVCAQALYQGQALTARDPALSKALLTAAQEEGDHLAWTRRRLQDLGSRPSLLDPLWYLGSFTMGAAAGLAGDRWSLGFLAETERQVEAHLDDHLQRLPREDGKSRAVLRQMKTDEARHAAAATARGGAELPLPLRFAMRMTARVMTGTTFYI